jgi:hypothetical protein
MTLNWWLFYHVFFALLPVRDYKELFQGISDGITACLFVLSGMGWGGGGESEMELLLLFLINGRELEKCRLKRVDCVRLRNPLMDRTSFMSLWKVQMIIFSFGGAM